MSERSSIPTAAPPAPPPPPPPAAAPSPPASAPPSSIEPTPLAVSRVRESSHLRSMLDPSSYTLAPTNGSSSMTTKSPSPVSSSRNGGSGTRFVVQDNRWRFVEESQFPRPRPFQPSVKRYRAGRGSSVPLDLSAL
ncbi:hypothetical protein F5Y17DRAFT_439868 [Xylariaceae sp. FL0594]|nr:hypothetical protein F5Y17DRAFT_439868 [Xylariaceae sp. FL0594]